MTSLFVCEPRSCIWVI